MWRPHKFTIQGETKWKMSILRDNKKWIQTAHYCNPKDCTAQASTFGRRLCLNCWNYLDRSRNCDGAKACASVRSGRFDIYYWTLDWSWHFVMLLLAHEEFRCTPLYIMSDNTTSVMIKTLAPICWLDAALVMRVTVPLHSGEEAVCLIVFPSALRYNVDVWRE